MVINPMWIGLAKAPERASSRGTSYAHTGRNAVLAQPEETLRDPVRPAAGVEAGTARSRPEPRPQLQPAPDATEMRAAATTAAVAEQQRMAELAYSCLLGDTYAWEALVRSQQRRVYALCYRFTGMPSQAEDLTQDVFLKVYRNLHSFDPTKASFGVWLTALTRNLLVDHYRRSRMDRISESLDVSSSGEDDGPTRAERLADSRGGQERHVAGVELRAKIQAALAQVSPELREAVILRDLEDMDYREIAETLCIPQGTVKSRISRGRAELARLLKGMEGQVV